MVKIRLRRMGKKKAPVDPSVYRIDEEAAKKWLSNGAQPTAEVAKLLKIAGVVK